MVTLKTNIKYLKGVGEKKAEIFQKELEISTIGDLLYYFPYKYIDRTKIFKISDLTPEMPYVQLKGRITSFRTEGQKYKERLVASFIDGSGSLELVWFQGIKWVKDSIEIGKEYIIFGKPNEFRGSFNIPHPDIDEIALEDSLTSGLEAAYITPEKLKKKFITSKVIHKLQKTAISELSVTVIDPLPLFITERLGLINLHKALQNVHFPENVELLEKARYRFKFEELFLYS